METPALEIFRNGVDQAQATWCSVEQEVALVTPRQLFPLKPVRGSLLLRFLI